MRENELRRDSFVTEFGLFWYFEWGEGKIGKGYEKAKWQKRGRNFKKDE